MPSSGRKLMYHPKKSSLLWGYGRPPTRSEPFDENISCHPAPRLCYTGNCRSDPTGPDRFGRHIERVNRVSVSRRVIVGASVNKMIRSSHGISRRSWPQLGLTQVYAALCFDRAQNTATMFGGAKSLISPHETHCVKLYRPHLSANPSVRQYDSVR